MKRGRKSLFFVFLIWGIYKPKIEKSMIAHSKHKVCGIVSATETLKAGGFSAWAKKTGYSSRDVKMSGIISLTDKQLIEALNSVD